MELDREDVLALLALGVLNPPLEVEFDEVEDEDGGGVVSMSRRLLT